MSTWHSDAPPPAARITPLGWGLAAVRGLALAVLIFGLFALLLALRLPERAAFGPRRPFTPRITQFACKGALAILGIRRRVIGQPMRADGVLVANHASWLDIFALNACDRVFFVAKSEVAGWPVIGWLAGGAGTLFIDRDRKAAERHRRLLTERLRLGQRLLFFPEGTSTDGRRVLSFKSTLFSAVFEGNLASQLSVQPVSVIYRAPEGADPRYYGWWGDMEFGTHLLQVLATPRQGEVTLVFHPPVRVDEAGDRKVLAAVTEAAVRRGVEARLQGG